MLNQKTREAADGLAEAAFRYGLFAASKGISYTDEQGRENVYLEDSSEKQRRFNDVARKRAVLSISESIGHQVNGGFFEVNKAVAHAYSFMRHNLLKFSTVIPLYLRGNFSLSSDIPRDNTEDQSNYLEMESLNFELALAKYMDNVVKYKYLDWDQKQIKRDSFDYVPGDRLQIQEQTTEKIHSKKAKFWDKVSNYAILTALLGAIPLAYSVNSSHQGRATSPSQSIAPTNTIQNAETGLVKRLQ